MHQNKMILNIVTSVYFLSMIVMAFWINIRPFYVHDHWNKTQLLSQKNVTYKTEQELGSLDIIVVINLHLVMVSLFGKWSLIRNYMELFDQFQQFLVIC